MPVGVRLKSVRCIDETTSGRRERVRDRRRRWASDEMAMFTAMHDGDSGRLLAVHKFWKTGVDSGDEFHPEQSMLGPGDSTSTIGVTVVGYEFDGRGSTESLVNDKYAEWVDVVSAGDWGLSLTDTAARTAARIFLVPFAARRVMRDDLIMLDRFRIEEDEVTGSDTPESEFYTPSDTEEGLSVGARYQRLPDGELQSTRTYSARAQHSVYEVALSFRT